MVTLTIWLDGEAIAEDFDSKDEAVDFYSEGRKLGLPADWAEVDGERIEADPDYVVDPLLAEMFALIQQLG